MTPEDEVLRSRIMAARAAVDRACRAFSNEPGEEYQELAGIRSEIEQLMSRCVDKRDWPIVWPPWN